MKYFRTAAVVALALASVAPLAHAQTSMAQSSMQRQQLQMARIEQGVQRGEISPTQYRNLMRGQQQITSLRRRAMADGVVTPREEQVISQAQDIQSQQIQRARHGAF